MEDLHPLPKTKHSSFQIYTRIRSLQLYLSALRKKKNTVYCGDFPGGDGNS